MSLPYILLLAAAEGDQNTVSLLIAFGVLAAVLVILLGYYMAAAKKSALPAQPIVASPVIIAEQPAPATNDYELIAVISAAVAAYLNNTADESGTVPVYDTPVTKFRVVSFRKVK